MNNKNNNNELGEFITTARKKLIMTQKELSQLVDISENSINFIETGRTKSPQKPTLKKLSEVLEVPFEKLIELAGYERPDIVARKYYSKTKEKNEWFAQTPMLYNINENEKINVSSANMKKIKGGNILRMNDALETDNIEVTELWKRQGDYVFIPEDNSLQEYGILNGDQVLIKEQEEFKDGDKVLIVIDHGELKVTIKEVRYCNGELKFLNKQNDFVEITKYIIKGKVIARQGNI